MHNMSNQDITIAKLEAAVEQLNAVLEEVMRWEHNLTATKNNITEVVATLKKETVKGGSHGENEII